MLQDTSQAIADLKVQLRLIDAQLLRVEPRWSKEIPNRLARNFCPSVALGILLPNKTQKVCS